MGGGGGLIHIQYKRIEQPSEPVLLFHRVLFK